MRMMGAESVAYHQATIVERGDDFPGQALAYYASRGETPLLWGGAGAAGLGLTGAVSQGEYEAVYGPGGARHPVTGERLVSTRRPGMEIVISAHKSVAELGVIGRAEDMHKIMDAERDATLAYLEMVTQAGGGRRGREAITTPTSGLVYAVTRHATSRAGDPCPHDHVLLANLVEMLDGQGGYKAAITAHWREHLYAATMMGRVAAARTAVELGYGIAADPGPSGRLRHWRIAGIPNEILELHSKRAAEITAEVEARGDTSYRARRVAARTTRAVKRHTPTGELLDRWRDEITDAGWPLERLLASVEAASGERIAGTIAARTARQALGEALQDDGELARRKVFSRRHLITEVAPHLYGWEPRQVAAVIDAGVADRRVIPLVGVAGAIEPAYALASVLAREGVIADRLRHQLERADAPTSSAEHVTAAIDRTEAKLGRPLADEQRRAVENICSSGRGAELVVGVAGAGKTTMLAAVAAAFEASGCEVIGTATAGQAARNLGKGAELEASSTLASLTARLARGQLELEERSVVILDEAGMTDDIDLARLITQVQVAGAKLVMVGDHRQLGSVGPGGAMQALVARHPDAIHHLVENRRQHDPAERRTLEKLRDGDVKQAVGWYIDHDRIRAVPDRDDALQAAVDAWAGDQAAGKQTLLLAWRRANVAELNIRAREQLADTGKLTGPELVVEDRAFQAGDQVVTLATDRTVGLVTSQRATVTQVHPDQRSLEVCTDDGRLVTLTGEQLDRERLDYGYATTVHRAQGATVDRAHLFADGGGRELAYVAMSRARGTSAVWVVADDTAQAAEDLRHDWSTRTTPTWAIDTGLPDPHHLTKTQAARLTDQQKQHVLAVAQARSAATVEAMQVPIPARSSVEVEQIHAELNQTRSALNDLASGTGAYQDTPIGSACRAATAAEQRVALLQQTLASGGWRERRHANHELPVATAALQTAKERRDALTGPESGRLQQKVERLETATTELEQAGHRSHERQHHFVDQRRVVAHQVGVIDRRLEHLRHSSPEGQPSKGSDRVLPNEFEPYPPGLDHTAPHYEAPGL